ncbi:MAG TPA: outer membrane beta-barrel protein [Gammaproteobacteria bacterium]|nr:outer membrane beta-barrel protein [Gammaproteobacteria bacterium]
MTKQAFLGIAGAVSLAMFSQITAAAGFNYTYMEGGYRNVDSDPADGEGVRVALSYGATDYIHVVAEYTRLWIDDIDDASSVNIDLDEFQVGFGGHFSITDKVDLVGTVSYVDDQYTGKARPDGLSYKARINDKEEGYEAKVYGRIQALKKLEMTPHVIHRDVTDSETGFGLGMVYGLNRKFAIRFEGTHYSDESTTDLFLGVRFNM